MPEPDVFALDQIRSVPLAERLLLGVSVHRRPVPETALVWQVGAAPQLPRSPEPDPLPEVEIPEGFAAALRVLGDLGLLIFTETAEGKGWRVQPDTASRIALRATKEDLAESHRIAALYWRWQYTDGPEDRVEEVSNLLEARFHHIEAASLDEATLVTHWLCDFFDAAGEYRRQEDLIHDQLGRLSEEEEKAPFYLQLGIVAQETGDYDQAVDWCRKSLAILEKVGNRDGIAAAYHQLGSIAKNRGNYDQALDYYRKTLAIAEEIESRAGMGASYHQIAMVAHLRGDYDLALDGYRASLAIAEELDSLEDIASSCHQLGILAQDRGDSDRALVWYRKALAINEETGNRPDIAASYHQLGSVAQDRGEHAKAIDFFRKSLAINEEIGNRSGMASSYHELGLVAQDRGDGDEALAWYRKSLAIDEELEEMDGMAATVSQIGILLTEQGKAAEAVPWNLRSLTIRLELDVPQSQIDVSWLVRQREAIGDKSFRRILAEHLDEDSRSEVWELVESFEEER